MLARELLKGVASGVLCDGGVAQPPVENLEVEVMDLLLLLLDGMVARGRGITYAGCLLPSSLILAMVLAHFYS